MWPARCLPQSYRDAALTYEQLVRFHEDEPRYRLYYAQSLYKAGLYADVRVYRVAVRSVCVSVSTSTSISVCVRLSVIARLAFLQAEKASKRVDSDVYAQRVLMLQAATSYELNDMATCKSLVDQMLPDEPDTIVNSACILYRCVAGVHVCVGGGGVMVRHRCVRASGRRSTKRPG